MMKTAGNEETDKQITILIFMIRNNEHDERSQER